MVLYSVKENILLKKQSKLLTKPQINNLIYKIINFLINMKDTKKEFCLNLDDGRQIHTKEWYGWEWTQGIALYSIYKFYQLTKNVYLLKIIDDWFNYHFINELPTKNINTICPLLTLAYRYQDTKNSAFLPILEKWSNWLIYDLPRTKAQGFQHLVYHNDNKEEIWDDTLMMSVLPLVKIGLILKKNNLIDEAIFQILIHNKFLFNINSGLWFHGWNFKNLNHLSSVEWGRGNSWITIVIPEIIELINFYSGNPIKKFLIEILKIQIETLKKYQDETGLWHTILNDNNSYLELSCSAGFAYGILKSINNRYINKKYFNVAEKAIKGILNNISTEGEIQKVSAGTAIGNKKEYYNNISLTAMPYGQALVILALTEYLKF